MWKKVTFYFVTTKYSLKGHFKFLIKQRSFCFCFHVTDFTIVGVQSVRDHELSGCQIFEGVTFTELTFTESPRLPLVWGLGFLSPLGPMVIWFSPTGDPRPEGGWQGGANSLSPPLPLKAIDPTSLHQSVIDAPFI